MPRPSEKNIKIPNLIANIVTEVMGTDKEIEVEPTKEQRMLLGRWNKENKIMDMRSIMVLKRNGNAPIKTMKFKKTTFMKF